MRILTFKSREEEVNRWIHAGVEPKKQTRYQDILTSRMADAKLVEQCPNGTQHELNVLILHILDLCLCIQSIPRHFRCFKAVNFCMSKLLNQAAFARTNSQTTSSFTWKEVCFSQLGKKIVPKENFTIYW